MAFAFIVIHSKLNTHTQLLAVCVNGSWKCQELADVIGCSFFFVTPSIARPRFGNNDSMGCMYR